MERKTYMVFKYSSGKSFYYIELSDLSVNDGRSFEGVLGHYYNKKLGSGSCGAIHQVTERDGGIIFNPKQLPVEYWKNRDDLAAWRSRQSASDSVTKTLNEGKVNHLEKILEHINYEYNKASYIEQRLMLADIIRIVTKPRFVR